MAREAHSIRGAAGLFGAAGAHEIAAAIEDGSRHLGPADIEEALRELATAIDPEER